MVDTTMSRHSLATAIRSFIESLKTESLCITRDTCIRSRWHVRVLTVQQAGFVEADYYITCSHYRTLARQVYNA